MRTEAEWLSFLHELEADLQPRFAELEAREEEQTAVILAAYSRAAVGQHHFSPSTGYGYNDLGRETLERVFADLWGADAALVRQQLTSGTQAINLCLQATARAGREILFAGEPYDTLRVATGLEGNSPGNLRERGVRLRVAELAEDIETWPRDLAGQVTDATQLLYLQRSAGYSGRRGLSLESMGRIIGAVRRISPGIIVFVDNCYGEFVEDREPLSVGADLMAGSLIKNPGGGLAPTGGYAAGRRDLVSRVAAQLFAPGIEGEIGPSLISLRPFFQGLFIAPHLVGQALRGAILAARAFSALGYQVSPAWNSSRTDLVQRIVLGSQAALITCCRALQAASPIDSRLVPEPAPLPGYRDQILMAGGTFVQGSTSELSLDAPLRPPFAAYWQGGLSYAHARLALAGVLAALEPPAPAKA